MSTFNASSFDAAQDKTFGAAQSKKLVFDIETIGVDFNSLDKISQDYLLQYAEDEEEENKIKEQLGFSPLTGEIVAIGILNPDTMKGAIYLKANGKSQIANNELGEGIIVGFGTEKEILEKFWETVKSHNYFISFNGRGFDVPFLMIRSAILGVKPSKNLLSNRYLNSQKWDSVHVDLADQFTFYSAFRQRSNLHMFAKAFGVKSPKEQGIDGYEVGNLYKEGKLLEIAKYNLGDLRATKELYEKWHRYLNL